MFGNKNNTDIQFHLFQDKRFILEEQNNQMKVLQLGKWGGKDDIPTDEKSCKWECRTIYNKPDGTEQMGKGCSFSEEGINELARVLVEQGKGNTKDILTAMHDRKDFMPSLKIVLGNEAEDNGIDLSDVDDEYYNADDILQDTESAISSTNDY